MSQSAADGPETAEAPIPAEAASPAEPASPGAAPPGDSGPDEAPDLSALSVEGLLDDVERLTGHPATTFRQLLERSATSAPGVG